MEQLPENIVSLDMVRINRGMDKICKCKMRKFVVDSVNKRVTCSGCGSPVEAFDAISEIATRHEEYTEQVKRLLEQKKQIVNYKPWLKVIKNIETQYRGRKMIPGCPRCSEPFYLEEIVRWFGKEFADMRIEKWKEENKDQD